MKVDNEKVLRKQREKKAAMVIAARRRQKEMVRRMEAMTCEAEIGKIYEKHPGGDRI